MNCDRCKKDLSECKCSDIDERMRGLKNNPNFIYKICLKCDKHYKRCKCEDPNWGTSHDSVTLEEALSTPTLADRISAKQSSVFSTSDDEKIQRLKDAGAIEVDDLNNAPAEIRETVQKLNDIGVGVTIFKGDPEKIKKIIGEGENVSGNKGNFKSNADVMDNLHYEEYKRQGGKLN